MNTSFIFLKTESHHQRLCIKTQLRRMAPELYKKGNLIQLLSRVTIVTPADGKAAAAGHSCNSAHRPTDQPDCTLQSPPTRRFNYSRKEGTASVVLLHQQMDNNWQSSLRNGFNFDLYLQVISSLRHT